MAQKSQKKKKRKEILKSHCSLLDQSDFKIVLMTVEIINVFHLFFYSSFQSINIFYSSALETTLVLLLAVVLFIYLIEEIHKHIFPTFQKYEAVFLKKGCYL